MDKMTTGAAYSASLTSALAGLVTTFTHEQWNVIGILVGIGFAALTWVVNFYYKVKDDRRKERYAQHHHGKN